MPMYAYFCYACQLEKEVIKPMDEHARPEFCDECGQELIRDFNYGTAIWKGDPPDTASAGRPTGTDHHNYKCGKLKEACAKRRAKNRAPQYSKDWNQIQQLTKEIKSGQLDVKDYEKVKNKGKETKK